MADVARHALHCDYDQIIFDLDGVLYVGPHAVPQAAQVVTDLVTLGKPVAYATNNASRAAAVVAEHLRELGIPATDAQVVTAAQVGAALLAQRHSSGTPVLVVGTDSLANLVRDSGLQPVPRQTPPSQVGAVIQGFNPDLSWRDLAAAAHAIQAGADWVATNLDRTIPVELGIAPGNGSLVAAVSAATGKSPVSAGKPEPHMFWQCAQRAEAQRALVVGDRLDTDIAGALAAGMDSLAVLSGVTGPIDLVTAAPSQRPTFIADDVSGLMAEVVKPEGGELSAHCGGASVHWSGGVLVADAPTVAAGPGRLDLLRATCAAIWARHPHTAAETSCLSPQLQAELVGKR